MSSTNRSKARDLHIADYYVTPIPVIERKKGVIIWQKYRTINIILHLIWLNT